MSGLRLGILTSHPIQYYSPIFRELARRAPIRVFFAHRASAADQAGAGYGVPFEWDTDLLGGFEHVFLKNVARRPGVSSFFSCDTPSVAAEIGRGGFDAFLVTGWNLKCYWQAVGACRRERVPVLVRGDSQLETPRHPVKNFFKSAVYPGLVRRFDGFLAVGERSRAYFMRYGAPAGRVFLSPHCVDTGWFAARAAEAAGRRAALRSEAGARPGETQILFVGRLVDQKRPLDLVAACARLAERGRPSRLWIVGAGPLEDAVRRSAAAAGVPVHFAGFKNQTELPAYYAAADLLALPSDARETWGLVVNEAMACGLPAVVSDAAGCSADLVIEGETGSVFRTGDAAALAEAVERFLPRRDKPETTAALRRVTAAHSPASAADGILEAAKAVRKGRE
ncbi:MAG TPA: glycosyltransferase family 4 protein [Candidatus Eisenbacteria bacterium]|nr:glycosyltransferase family 4 protein [Candidatus Eisenbacteria bacterium]